ncbi:hypothetical protein Y88_1144 [Novosphingobium nitrogenifigens DSM 19370]|uniref:Lipopolysaccharide biosynthesis protein n=1 Tax=Novosphingobium nitrogenifigens DSM 19370 TaxID=983920 RepID=F1Z8E3_9SPHN|nr:hypothetical protein [Novosphingobium nitrogenifigens]EGD59082.1 hypothetical protein Y88_1144 [Novosphingobium nitrogenifigens DSM 19370]
MTTGAPATPSPRRLVRAWIVVRDGLPSFGRYRRYVTSMALPVLALWVLTAIYLVAAPVSYTSKMTLILPGSGVGGSINVDQIGQASTVTSSAFASATLSPTVNYKRLLMTDMTVRHAAARLGMKPSAFPQPDIKLTDQTNLIEVSVKGPTPKAAHDRLEALRDTFLENLEQLRADEAAKREEVDRSAIARLQQKAHETQQRLLDFQSHSGLVSEEQFRNRIAALDALKDRYRQTIAELRQQNAQTGRLSQSLNAGVVDARVAMVLKADQPFQSLLGRYAQINTGLAEKAATLGDRHGLVRELSAQDRELRDQLAARGSALTGLSRDRVLKLIDLSVSDGRSALMQNLVSFDSQASGTRAGAEEIARQISDQTMKSRQLVAEASQLADLDRDLKVADAVLSSALARLDTNKADPFASYPLVQTLEAPSLPERKTSPSPLLALAGALAGTVFIFIGFGLVWIRQPIIQMILRKF